MAVEKSSSSMAASAFVVADASRSTTASSAAVSGPGSGSAPSRYFPTIAVDRDARLPRPFANSEVYRADMSSQEKEPSWPKLMARMK